MTSTRPLRIAILAHSTNPRGGVVHALALGDALVRLGVEAVVHAPDVNGSGFFRDTLCRTVSVPASPVGKDMTGMVETRVADYVRHFETGANRRFDVFHAQDGISANALASLKERGLIGRFARTVHHIDAFRDPRLDALQRHAITSADRHFVVSHAWRERLAADFGIDAVVVGNGVDGGRFTSVADGREAGLMRRLGLGEGPVLLAIGGVEARKNAIGILEAFILFHAQHPSAQLIIAGGASLLDHDAYRVRFRETLAASGLLPWAVIEAGPIPQADMPALYRIADALVFPSLNEGFGLVVLEAMASERPVIVSRIAPFTEYLGEDDAAWCDPVNPASISAAITAALTEPQRTQFIQRGRDVARRHDWLGTARAHLATYNALKEPTDA
jgi:glycosyltransferase-like protein